MNYKVTKANEAVKYAAPGHFDVRTTRLHNPEDIENGEVVFGLSHFLPGGGADKAPAKFEMIYYIVKGEMTIKIYDENENHNEYILNCGDSIHFGANTKRGCINTGNSSAEMLTVMIKTTNR